MSTLPEMTIFHGHTELLTMLNGANVRFLVIGGVAVRFYASDRQPGDDIDVLVDKSAENAGRAATVLQRFTTDDVVERFTRSAKQQLKIGPIIYADVVTADDDFDFDSAWQDGVDARLNGQPARIIAKQQLIQMKTGTGREKDATDLILLGVGGD